MESAEAEEAEAKAEAGATVLTAAVATAAEGAAAAAKTAQQQQQQQQLLKPLLALDPAQLSSYTSCLATQLANNPPFSRLWPSPHLHPLSSHSKRLV